MLSYSFIITYLYTLNTLLSSLSTIISYYWHIITNSYYSYYCVDFIVMKIEVVMLNSSSKLIVITCL